VYLLYDVPYKLHAVRLYVCKEHKRRDANRLYGEGQFHLAPRTVPAMTYPFNRLHARILTGPHMHVLVTSYNVSTTDLFINQITMYVFESAFVIAIVSIVLAACCSIDMRVQLGT
jgi:hypothetical protein